MEIQEILETINEQEFKTFVQHLWQEKWQITKDFEAQISTGATFSEFRCYKRLTPEMQANIDGIGKTPAEFVMILCGFLNEFIIKNVSTYTKEDYDWIGLPDLLDDYFKIKKKNKISDITNNFTDAETEKLMEELGTANTATTYSHFSFYTNFSEEGKIFWENCKSVQEFVEHMRWIFMRDTIRRVEQLTIEDLDPLPTKELIEIFTKGMEIESLKKQIDFIVAGQMEPIIADGTEEIIE